MKTSIKIAALALVLFGAALKSSAQTTTKSSDDVKLSIGAESDLSMGSFKHLYKASVGGSAQADIPVASQFYAIVNAGYTQFIGKDNAYGTGLSAKDLHYLPAMAGLKYFPVANLYVQAAAGAAFVLNKTDVGYTNTAAFLYTPQAGYQFNLGGKSFLDASVRYEATTKFTGDVNNSKVNFLGLRVAYGFGL